MMETTINNVKLKFNEKGDAFRLIKRLEKNGGDYWKEIPNKASSDGYNRINIGNGKKIYRHNIIGQLFFNNKDLIVHHIDGNKLNNNINNLKLIPFQKCHFKQKKAKGYCKRGDRFEAYIDVGNRKYLGRFDTEDEAHNAYLEAKKIYHII